MTEEAAESADSAIQLLLAMSVLGVTAINLCAFLEPEGSPKLDVI